MKLKKLDLINVLMVLLQYDPKTNIEVSGLLTEEISLGLKRRLQKIRAELLKHYEELSIDEKELRDALTDKEKLNQELTELFNEEIEITQDPVRMSLIEEIKTSANYDFTIIEKIAV